MHGHLLRADFAGLDLLERGSYSTLVESGSYSLGRLAGVAEVVSEAAHVYPIYYQLSTHVAFTVA